MMKRGSRHNVSMWRAIVLYVIIIVVAATSLSSIVYSIYLSKVLNLNINSAFSDLCEKLAIECNQFLTETEMLAKSLSINAVVQNSMRHSDNYSLSEQYDNFYALKPIIALYEGFTQIDTCRLVFMQEAFYTHDNINIIYSESKAANELGINMTENSITDAKWDVWNGALRYIQPVYNYVHSQNPIGMVVLEFSPDVFVSMFSNIDSVENPAFEVQYGAESLFLYGEKTDAPEFEYSGVINKSFQLHASAKGFKYNISLNEILLRILPWVIGSSFAVLLIITLFAKKFYSEISDLSANIRSIDVFADSMIRPAKYAELDEIVTQFNTLIAHIRTKVADELRIRDEEKTLSIQMLEAQINPHFLYNSLDAINWLAYQEGAEDVAGMARSLGLFYRDALGKAKNESTIRRELEHVRTYLEIMRYRTEKDIHVRIEADKKYDEHIIPRLSIQPIVENAFVHGVLCRNQMDGNIRLYFSEGDGCLKITVKDDGPGMPQDALQRYLESLEIWPPVEMHGLYNIHHRTKFLYGVRYGISIESMEGSYMIVTLSIPLAQ